VHHEILFDVKANLDTKRNIVAADKHGVLHARMGRMMQRKPLAGKYAAQGCIDAGFIAENPVHAISVHFIDFIYGRRSALAKVAGEECAHINARMLIGSRADVSRRVGGSTTVEKLDKVNITRFIDTGVVVIQENEVRTAINLTRWRKNVPELLGVFFVVKLAKGGQISLCREPDLADVKKNGQCIISRQSRYVCSFACIDKKSVAVDLFPSERIVGGIGSLQEYKHALIEQVAQKGFVISLATVCKGNDDGQN